MSAPPHDGWPRVGDVFSHWSDLVLAAQLAALREGYTGLGPSWRLDRPTTLWVACRVNSGTFRGKMGRCDLWLVRAVMVDSSNSESGWIVDTVRIENVPVGVHVEHQGGIGTSNGFSIKPSKSPKLSKGRVVKSWKALHLLEASLRAASRLEGRYITGKSLYNASNEYSCFFSCVLGPRCTFYLRFDPHSQGVDGAGWRCTELCLQHSCHSGAPPVSDRMQEILSFWPAIRTKGDCMTPIARRIKVERYWVSMRDEAIGPYPVLEVGSDGEPIYPILADTKLSARLEIRRSALSKASEALSAARQSLLNLRTNVIALELVGDLDEAKALKKGIRTAEKVVVKKEKKWARKQAKVEKMKEKIERDTMKRRKLAGEKVTSSKIKKEKKEKKERKERKKEDKA